MGWNDFKGLRWYLLVVLFALSFFTYSQNIGWLWFGSTTTKPPTDQAGQTTRGHGSGGYRYLHHK